MDVEINTQMSNMWPFYFIDQYFERYEDVYDPLTHFPLNNKFQRFFYINRNTEIKKQIYKGHK